MTALILQALLAAPPSYGDRHAQAVREGMPLVVFVGIPSHYVPGAIVHEEPKGFPWHRAPGVLITLPRDGWLEWTETLPATASPQEVRDSLKRPTGRVYLPRPASPPPVYVPRPMYFRPASFGGC